MLLFFFFISLPFMVNKRFSVAQTMPPLTKSAPISERYRKKNRNSYKHHIFAPTAGARCTIFPQLCTVIEHVETIKKVAIVFRFNA